tara:strand:- start:2601 stop:3236 length:636 start_codon:yes stop_codon:yes gene_type:complete
MSDERPVEKYIKNNHGLTHEHHVYLMKAKNDIQKIDLKPKGQGQYQNQYLPLEQIIEEIEPIMRKHEFHVHFDEIIQDNPNILICKMICVFVKTGTEIIKCVQMPCDKATSQGRKGAWTYAKRQCYQNLLSLPDKDNDGLEDMTYLQRLKAVGEMTKDFKDDEGNSLEDVREIAERNYWIKVKGDKAKRNDITTKDKKPTNPLDALKQQDQ